MISGSPLDYLLYHRGVTHSLVLLPVWALGLSWLLAKIVREPLGWRALYGITALSLALHIAADVITSYGTMILAPFSDWRAAIGTTFIIDLWFSGIIVTGLIASAMFYRSRLPAISALAVLVAYVGFQYVQRQHALDFARKHGAQNGLAQIKVHPRPVSPFNWTVFASDDEKHEMAHINLIRREPRAYRPGEGFIARIDSPYLPLDQAIWVRRSRYGETEKARIREAWDSDALRVFRWFADLPAYDGKAGDCYYFIDLRFYTPGREAAPFRFGACGGPSWTLSPP